MQWLNTKGKIEREIVPPISDNVKRLEKRIEELEKKNNPSYQALEDRLMATLTETMNKTLKRRVKSMISRKINSITRLDK